MLYLYCKIRGFRDSPLGNFRICGILISQQALCYILLNVFIYKKLKLRGALVFTRNQPV